MRAVDTNVLIRFLTRDDPSQDMIARSILLGGNVWIPKTVLLEAEWVLRSSYGFTRRAIHSALDELLGLPGIQTEQPEAVALALRLFGAGLDFADALHLASRPDGTRFVTFDDVLVKRAKQEGVVGITKAEP